MKNKILIAEIGAVLQLLASAAGTFLFAILLTVFLVSSSSLDLNTVPQAEANLPEKEGREWHISVEIGGQAFDTYPVGRGMDFTAMGICLLSSFSEIVCAAYGFKKRNFGNAIGLSWLFAVIWILSIFFLALDGLCKWAVLILPFLALVGSSLTAVKEGEIKKF